MTDKIQVVDSARIGAAGDGYLYIRSALALAAVPAGKAGRAGGGTAVCILALPAYSNIFTGFNRGWADNIAGYFGLGQGFFADGKRCIFNIGLIVFVQIFHADLVGAIVCWRRTPGPAFEVIQLPAQPGARLRAAAAGRVTAGGAAAAPVNIDGVARRDAGGHKVHPVDAEGHRIDGADFTAVVNLDAAVVGEIYNGLVGKFTQHFVIEAQLLRGGRAGKHKGGCEQAGRQNIFKGEIVRHKLGFHDLNLECFRRPSTGTGMVIVLFSAWAVSSPIWAVLTAGQSFYCCPGWLCTLLFFRHRAESKGPLGLYSSRMRR